MIIRQISGAFDPVYLKPKVLAGAIKQLLPCALPMTALQGDMLRSGQERRQGDRRQRKQHVMLELRSPYSRRHISGRRNHDFLTGRLDCGIDLYV